VAALLLNLKCWWADAAKRAASKLAKTPQKPNSSRTQILGMEIKGFPVRKVLVDEASAIDHEIYFAITDDRAAKKPVMIASAAGGMDIEEVALRRLLKRSSKSILIRCWACVNIRRAMSPLRLTCRVITGAISPRSRHGTYGKCISQRRIPG
jgi:hypothetical protein